MGGAFLDDGGIDGLTATRDGVTTSEKEKSNPEIVSFFLSRVPSISS